MVDHIEQGGDPLHLVEDDDLRLGMAVHEFPEPFGTRREALVDFGLEEIDPERVGERLPQEGGFAGARGPNRK